MSDKHLAKGAPFPPLRDGVVRLYSMRFCPYAERCRLVLAAKGIEHEIVNCSLMEKAEWLLERSPDGNVPVLEHNGKVLFESLIINDYLDEVFPARSLNPKDPYQKATDRILLQGVFTNQVMDTLTPIRRSKGGDKENAEKLSDGLAKLETELKKRGTKFFGGSQPAMVDYNMWPWIVKTDLMKHSGLTFIGDNLPLLKTYIESMMLDEAVKATQAPRDLIMRFTELWDEDTAIQYDFED